MQLITLEWLIKEVLVECSETKFQTQFVTALYCYVTRCKIFIVKHG